jgi:asparagine synthase (glutamine-hydrolysing)
MSGLWGFVLADPRGRADISDLAVMGAESHTGATHALHEVAAGPAALATQEFPHRAAAVARRQVGDSILLLALHGSIVELDDSGSTHEGQAPGSASLLADRLLEGYLGAGPDLWQRLRGDFVIAVWDGRDATFRVACDRFRIHPLFYSLDMRGLTFGSRIAPVLARPGTGSPSIDADSVLEVLLASVIPTPKTIYERVAKLPPGTELVYRSGTMTLRPYWDMVFGTSERPSERQLARDLRESLEDAMRVRLAMDRDASYGAFLSGGIDSTTVLGLATKIAGRPVKSFSIGFGEPRFNEMEYARIAARAFGSEHHEYFVQPEDVVRAIPTLLDAYDEPFGNASAIPTFYCATVAREHGIDVLYAGDGGDELFAGNERYSIQRLFGYYQKVPGWLREPVLRPLVEALAATKVPLFVKGAKYVRRARTPYVDRISSYDLDHVLPLDEIVAPAQLERITREHSHKALLSHYYRSAAAEDDLDRHLYLDLKLTISDNDLIKVTRATEAAGVAVRFPFLDSRVAEVAGAVPARIRMRGTELRSFFKRAYSDFLPPETIAKTKHGFGLPIPVWLRTDPTLNGMMRDLVLGPSNRVAGYFRRSALETLVERHSTDPTTYYGVFLWNLMVLELWLRRHASTA